jgi:thioredoxin 1
MLFLILSLSLAACKKDLVDPTANAIGDVASLAQFRSEISEGTAMVFFFAVWCENCEELRPTIETVSENQEFSKVTFIEVDYDATRDIFSEYGVKSFPQVLFFKEGVEQERLVGKNQSEQKIADTLKRHF